MNKKLSCKGNKIPRIIMSQYNRQIPKKILNTYKSQCLLIDTDEHELLIRFMEYISNLRGEALLNFVEIINNGKEFCHKEQIENYKTKLKGIELKIKNISEFFIED